MSGMDLDEEDEKFSTNEDENGKKKKHSEKHGSSNRDKENKDLNDGENNTGTMKPLPLVESSVAKKPKLPEASIRRMCHEVGVQRMRKDVFEQSNEAARQYTYKLLQNAYLQAKMNDRDVINADDMIKALKFQGENVYGFNSDK